MQKELRELAARLGDVVGSSVLRGDDGPLALAVHAVHQDEPDVDIIAAACAFHEKVLVMRSKNAAFSALVALRVLVYARRNELEAGRIITLPADADGVGLVRGAPGAFALVPAALERSFAALPASALLVVGVRPPLDVWTTVTPEELKEHVPDLVTRFAIADDDDDALADADVPAPPPAPPRKHVLRRR